jgi:hypothetical protein
MNGNGNGKGRKKKIKEKLRKKRIWAESRTKLKKSLS